MSDNTVACLNKYQVNKTLRTKIKKSIPKPVLCATHKILWYICYELYKIHYIFQNRKNFIAKRCISIQAVH